MNKVRFCVCVSFLSILDLKEYLILKACEKIYLASVITFCCSLIVLILEKDYFDLKIVDFIWFYGYFLLWHCESFWKNL
jgi:hypothetical protein